MAFEAVIFDMDGLLFDTESLGVKACIYAGQQQGLDVSEEVVLTTLGTTEAKSDSIYLAHYPSYQAKQFWQDFSDWMVAYVEENAVGIMPYAQEMVIATRNKGIKTAICSGSPMSRVELYLEKTNMQGLFDAYVTQDDGARSKPEPDMFLLTAEKLNVSPDKCLVLEDSPNGLRAAHAAGMQAYMVPDQIPFRDEYAPFTAGVLKDLSQALPLLDK